ncbi:MAG: hydrolase [Phycisphaeraceae bacterium]|nr:MAG: hydrolase [Phycisphaeraceae bacterium]
MPVNERPADRPDHPGALWAPWRLSYLESIDAPDRPADAPPFLADYWAHPERDEANLVVVRNDFGMILLNRYPYANGHLLVALGDGRPRLLDYDPAQRAALWSLVELGTDLLERTLEPQGVNVGINQGRAAGAGVPGHLHVHLVPRWGGDVNFMSAVGSVRVIGAALEQMYERFTLAWREHPANG